MQQEKFVLPKFTVPGERRWGKWVVAGVGTLVAVNLILFGVVLSKRSGAQATVAAQGATRTAEAPALAPSAMPTPLPQPKAALAATTAVAADRAEPEAAKGDEVAPAKPAKAVSHRPHRSRNKSLAKATTTEHHASAGSSGKPDAIDELLKRAFK
jgi:hypothetical protein